MLMLLLLLLLLLLGSAGASPIGLPQPYVLPLLPAAPPGAQSFFNTTMSSWGGSVLRHSGQYHLYASACLGGCNLPAWQSNSATIHAVSSNATGPFRYSAIALAPWHTNPQVVQAPDGTLLLFTLGARGVPAPVRCGVGPTAPPVVATCNISGACCGQTPPRSCRLPRADRSPTRQTFSLATPRFSVAFFSEKSWSWRPHLRLCSAAVRHRCCCYHSS